MKNSQQSFITTALCLLFPAILFAQFQPKDRFSWDYWFVASSDSLHAFYLQYPIDGDKAYRHSRQSVGHAVSKDMISWIERPTALMAKAGTWNDVGIATGSVVYNDDKWWMVFSGNSTSKGGIGLAYSVDLYNWTKYGSEPIIPWKTKYTVTWKGQTLTCRPIADPYIFPKKI